MPRRNMQEDLKRLADAVFDNLTMINEEHGGIGLDPKRPFGNSYVEKDILRIIGIKPDEDGDYTGPQEDYANKLYFEKIIPYLKYHWKRRAKTHKEATKSIRTLNIERELRGCTAIRVCNDIFEALDKPASELLEILVRLKREWHKSDV